MLAETTSVRRLRVLTELVAAPADTWAAVMDCVAKAPVDLPFAALYEIDGDVARLVGTTGVILPDRRPAGEADTSGATTILAGLRLSSEDQAQQHRALLVPLPGGLLVAGIADELPLDDDYRSFLLALGRHVGAVMAGRRAEADARANDELLRLISHELRNLMSPVLLAVQIIQRQAGATFARELALIDREVRHLDGLVEDVVDVSRLARGKLDLNLTPLDLRQVLERVLAMLAPQLGARGQQVTIDVEGDRVVSGDAARLTRVFSTMLASACRHGAAGGRIDIRVFPQGADNLIVIEDEGGQAEERLGVAASLVKSLVELHGGSVDFRAENGATRATVRLPGTTDASRPAAGDAPARERKRVLVVDDDADAADVMAMALRSRGYDARVAYDGPSALELTETFRPDVALLDLSLPQMDGYEVAARIKKLSGGEDICLVALTGYSDAHADRAAGFMRHFVKPVDAATIDRTLRQLLDRKS